MDVRLEVESQPKGSRSLRHRVPVWVKGPTVRRKLVKLMEHSISPVHKKTE